jgi:hypothetical protein
MAGQAAGIVSSGAENREAIDGLRIELGHKHPRNWRRIDSRDGIKHQDAPDGRTVLDGGARRLPARCERTQIEQPDLAVSSVT